ncbi:hypothetical protein [Butyrivibrio sp. MC2021]|uniref:hypothetical protein n=1 Tax=Butyrivibrio sp. MC2021 TaxID=1408306 RepID=UPI00047D4094|nr:hypothetical protein [Butyrivibrio sp. MC2021]
MNVLNATDVRKNWSVTLDAIVHDKPAYIKRTHDNIALMDVSTLNELLAGYKYTADKYDEDDGSVTLSLRELDIVVNDADLEATKRRLAEYIKEYAEEFYSEYNVWSKAPNRKGHIPYVFKALTLDTDSILEDIVCQNGKN